MTCRQWLTRRQWFLAAPGLPGLIGTSAFAAAAAPAGTAASLPATASNTADPVRPGRPWSFPRDHGAHPGAQIEWWYLTGRVVAAGERVFGFQITFFASRTGLSGAGNNRWAPTHLLFAHAALTNLSNQRHQHDHRMARWGGAGALGAASAAQADTDLRLGSWQLQRQAGASFSQYRVVVATEVPAPSGFAFDLRLQASQVPLLQGEQGYSRKGGGAASHYLSEPQLQAAGQVSVGRESLAVRGKAWLDHEWSDSLLPPAAVGWDWIGINLDNGDSLMAFRLRTAEGQVIWAGGSQRSQAGAVQAFAPAQVRFTPLRWWTSPTSGARYPVAWEIETPLGRQRLEALLDAQEIDGRRSTGTVYWEGLVALRDKANTMLGHGYLEMTGYAGPLRL